MRVLFACNRNSVRSPMAAALARHYFGHEIAFESAGVEAGDLDGFAIGAMGELGIDIAKYKPKSFEALEGQSFDLVITLSPEAHHRALDLLEDTKVEFWPTPDPTVAFDMGQPFHMIAESFRQVRDGLAKRILARFSSGGMGNL